MKKEASERSKNLKSKIFGANPLQINEEDSSWLVGGIVEKGFSDIRKAVPLGPFNAPRPSVLPFPVARHRSDGPHWAPKVGNLDANNNDYDYDYKDFERDDDLSGIDLAADAANPVHKKDKKSLDFSRWQEIMKNDGSSMLHGNGTEINVTESRAGKQMNELSTDIFGTQNAGLENSKSCRRISDGTCETEHSSILKVSCLKDRREEMEGMPQMDTINVYDDMGYTTNDNFIQPAQPMQTGIIDSDNMNVDSLESQIDAENRVRLAKMSAIEIAEAQAEIMAKLNPEMIKALKKRSQEKAKKLKRPLLDAGASVEVTSMQHSKDLPNLMVNTDHGSCLKKVKEVSENMQTEKETQISPNMGQQDHTSWNAWSKRVEHARTMRFSLDGVIVDFDASQESNNGEVMSQDGYNAANVSERDFLRTEGDPGSVGYTIKEAVALARSVVPGQRTIALHLIESVLDRAICGICRNQGDSLSRTDAVYGSTDWEAIWAFALGPEPELALLLRMCLDDNHNSVVLACAKAIQCALCCDMNEIMFDISEKASNHLNDVFTAPVFRSKPDISTGFLHGGFWKYNTKPSNICLIGEERGDQLEGERTIQDDIVVAGQDIVAGLVRMGILPRIVYLMETEPSVDLEECLISILIAIARHSPTCATAIMNCEKLVQTIANRFSLKEIKEVNACKIKSVVLVKVLARCEKKNCLKFIKNGILHQMTWHLYQHPFSFDQWVRSGKDACKCSSALLVEQLRLLNICINYGYCISEFADLFASVGMWLSLPKIDLLVENDVMNEYFAITKEVYLILNVLASRLPNLYSVMQETMDNISQDRDSWSWSHFGPIIDLALEWIDVKKIPYVSRFFGCQTEDQRLHRFQDSEVNSLLWVISSVLNMLSSFLKAVIPEDTTRLSNGNLPWIPDFIPKIGLKIIKNGYMGFFGESNALCNDHRPENGYIMEHLLHVRLESREEKAISSSCCLQGLICLVACVDKLIQSANLKTCDAPSNLPKLSREDTILADGILNTYEAEVRGVLTTLITLTTKEWQCIQPVEVFGRGGPAPGVGVGWGASGGGYWSLQNLVALQDARLLINLLEVSEYIPSKDPVDVDCINHSIQMLNSILTVCSIVGPGSSTVNKLLDIMFQVPVLKYLDFGIRQFLFLQKGSKPFGWNYTEEEYLSFATVLSAHFRNRWLSVKKKSKSRNETNHISHKTSIKHNQCLDTIHEDATITNVVREEINSMILEWAYQRLPLPAHWFLSAISTIDLEESTFPHKAPYNCHEVIKGGLFFLLGIESIHTFLASDFYSPVKRIPLVWKLHSLSAALLSGMSVLEEEKSRDTYQVLQNVYGEILEEKRLSSISNDLNREYLKFQSNIHANYSTFIETLVEQFAAVSYGDVVFGRQVALYLHQSVEASVRLATWNALSHARALDLLPPMDHCLAKLEGYLEPVEDNEKILEAYVKSWVSGALDKAATRNSMTFSLVLHHLSCFIFGNCADFMLPLRNKLVKYLLRNFSRKQQHEVMVVKLAVYKNPTIPTSELEERLKLLNEICKGDSSLMASVQKLSSAVKREFASL